MNLNEAIKRMYESKECIALPEWGGFWFVDADNLITVLTKDNEVTKTPWFKNYADRQDFVSVGSIDSFKDRIDKAKILSIGTRMATELDELRIKLSKAEKFFNSESAGEIDETAKVMLGKQIEVMKKYSNILEDRIELHNQSYNHLF